MQVAAHGSGITPTGGPRAPQAGTAGKGEEEVVVVEIDCSEVVEIKIKLVCVKIT